MIFLQLWPLKVKNGIGIVAPVAKLILLIHHEMSQWCLGDRWFHVCSVGPWGYEVQIIIYKQYLLIAEQFIVIIVQLIDSHKPIQGNEFVWIYCYLLSLLSLPSNLCQPIQGNEVLNEPAFFPLLFCSLQSTNALSGNKKQPYH